jgi:hypothetical protein
VEEKESIHQRWQEFLAVSGAKREPEYQRCYPEHVLYSLVQNAYDGVAGMGCRIVARETKDPIHSALNEAWVVFWQDPKNYVEWEREAVEKLQVLCNSTALWR